MHGYLSYSPSWSKTTLKGAPSFYLEDSGGFDEDPWWVCISSYLSWCLSLRRNEGKQFITLSPQSKVPYIFQLESLRHHSFILTVVEASCLSQQLSCTIVKALLCKVPFCLGHSLIPYERSSTMQSFFQSAVLCLSYHKKILHYKLKCYRIVPNCMSRPVHNIK